MNNIYGQPYQAVSPSYASPAYLPTPPSPGIGRLGGIGGGGGYVDPGSIVYTTTAGRDGQILYSIFSAEPSSYQTAQGRVDGIQWELVEVTLVQPVSIPPADRSFYAAWGTNGEKERQRMIEKWLYEQNTKIGRREDLNLRGSARYPAAADRERERRAQAQAIAAEEELALREQERRGRRISSNQMYGVNSGGDFPPYTRARSKSFSRYERADDELAMAMGRVDLDRTGYEDQQRRERRRSVSRGPIGINRNPSPGRLPDYTTGYEEQQRRERRLSVSHGMNRNPSPSRLPDYTSATVTTRPRKGSISAYPTAAEYSQGATYTTYGGPPGGGGGGGGGSPYMGQPGSMGGPVYPPGHILAGRPIPGLQPNEMSIGGGTVTSYRSPSPRPGQLGGGGVGGISSYRSSSPRPEAIYRAPSPRPDVTGLYRSSSRSRSRSRAPSPSAVSISPPSSFFRPGGSLAFPYTYFDPILITSDLNRLRREIPALPTVLLSHDVRPEDWTRCVKDILTSWFINKRPSNEIIIKRPAKMVAQLIDVWNACFFSPRGVELTLYRGRQRCSGPQAGRYDAYLDIVQDDDDEGYSSSDLSTISSSDSNEANAYEYLGYGVTSRYLPADGRWIADSRRAEKARREAKKLKAKQQRQREKERRRKEGFPYSLYLHCIGDGKPPRTALSDAASAAYAAAITGGRAY